MRTVPSNKLLWFAVAGGGVAWFVQFVVNLYFTWGKCVDPNAPRALGLPVHDWEIGLSIAAVITNLTAQGVALTLYRRSRRIDGVIDSELEGKGFAPPMGRVASLAMMAMLINFVTLLIIVMTGIGAPLLTACQQA
jgi:hypothetical protein